MIAYLDTSVLVKIYVLEPGTLEAKAAVAEASVAATSRVAYAEAAAAFARKLREQEFSRRDYSQVMADLKQDWGRFFVLEITQQIVELAGDLAYRRKLRGFDAIHLASAFQLGKLTGTPILFLAADLILTAAAKAEGLRTA